MKNSPAIKAFFLIWMISMIIGSILKIMHFYKGDLILQIAIASFLLFSGIAIYEVYTSKRINNSEKFMWIIGLLFLGFFTGIFYLFVGRKRIINVEPKV